MNKMETQSLIFVRRSADNKGLAPVGSLSLKHHYAYNSSPTPTVDGTQNRQRMTSEGSRSPE